METSLFTQDPFLFANATLSVTLSCPVQCANTMTGRCKFMDLLQLQADLTGPTCSLFSVGGRVIIFCGLCCLHYTITLRCLFFIHLWAPRSTCAHKMQVSPFFPPFFFCLLLPLFQYCITCQSSHHALPTTSLEFTLPQCDHTYRL